MSPHLLSQRSPPQPPATPAFPSSPLPTMKCLIFPQLTQPLSPSTVRHLLPDPPLLALSSPTRCSPTRSSGRSHCSAISICPLVEHPSLSLSSPCALSIVFLPLHCLSPLGRHKSVWSLSPTTPPPFLTLQGPSVAARRRKLSGG